MTFFEQLQKIEVPEEFGVLDYDDSLNLEAENYSNKVYRIAQNLGIKIEINWGVSQFVIILLDTKEVYKVPFTGIEYRSEEVYDEDEEIYDYQYSFDTFSENYSERTVELYQKAVDAGLEDVFAETKKVGYSVNGHPIYMQRYAVVDRNPSAPSEDSRNKAREYSKDKFNPFSIIWSALLIDQYGLDYFLKVLKFIEDEDIDDLHTNNYGFDAEGHVLIFDYASFFN